MTQATLAADGLRSPRAATLDLPALVDLFRRRWRLLAAITVLVAVLVVGATFFITPTYSATARLMVEPVAHSATTVVSDPNAAPDQAMVDTELAIMRSRQIAQDVVNTLHLETSPAFTEKGESAKDLVDTVGSGLHVQREGTTYIAAMTYSSHSPKMAAELANTFAQQYIQSRVDTRADQATQQSDYLGQRLKLLGAEAADADAKVASYKDRNGITTGGGTETVTDQQIGPLSGQLATVESEAAAARSRADQARAQIANGGLESVSGVLSSNTISDLRRQRAEVVRSQAEINARYGPMHPEAIKVQQQLRQLDGQIRQEAERIVSGLDSDARAAAAQAGALRGSLGQLKGQQAENARAQVDAESLERDAEAKRTAYNQLAQASQQSTQEAHYRDSQARIIERAQIPDRPSFPNRPLFAVLGVLLGGAAAVSLVLVLEILDTGLRTVEDVETDLGTPFLAAIPLLSRHRLRAAPARTAWDYVLAKPMSVYAEAIRTIRSHLQLSSDSRCQVVAVTSAAPGEGKSACAVALARIMALSGDKVLLVDCDLRRNALARLRDRPQEVGLIETLEGAPLASGVLRDEEGQLDLLLPRSASFSPRDVFRADALDRVLQQARAHYDFVILDTPPILAVAEARAVATSADAVIIVARWAKTPRKAVRTTYDRLVGDGAKVVGLVLSMVDLQSPGSSASNLYDPAYSSYYHS